MVESLELRQLVSENEINDEPAIISPKWSKIMRFPHVGVLLATLSSLFFSLSSVIVKGLVNIDPFELAACRFVGIMMPAIPIVIYNNDSIFPSGKRLKLVLRSVFGATGLMLSFYAFRYMPLGDASVIVFSVPVFVAIFAYLFLKEPCTLFDIATIVLTLIGVILITRPSCMFGNGQHALADHNDQYHNTWGAVAAFGATIFGANVYVIMRTLKTIHFAVIMANFGTFALIQTIAVAWYLGVFCWPKCGYERILIVALAVFSFVGQILLTLALQMENAGPVAIARTSDIVFAFIWQMLFFEEVPTIFSLAGAFLVTSSIMLHGLRKWVISLPENASLKLRLNLLAK